MCNEDDIRLIPKAARKRQNITVGNSPARNWSFRMSDLVVSGNEQFGRMTIIALSLATGNAVLEHECSSAERSGRARAHVEGRMQSLVLVQANKGTVLLPPKTITIRQVYGAGAAPEPAEK